MKERLTLKSGICLLAIASLSIAPVSAASSFDGDLYNDLQDQHKTQQWTSTAVHGAQGPIRSDFVDVQPTAADNYESISQYHAAQSFDMASGEYGAQGRIASEADMVMQRNREEWKHLTGPFDGSAD